MKVSVLFWLILVPTLILINWHAESSSATQPGTTHVFSLTIPKADDENLSERIQDTSRSVTELIEASVKLAIDPRISDSERSRALSLVEHFSPMYTAEKLIQSIDLYDDRDFYSGDIGRGRYPIVRTLINYGGPIHGQQPREVRVVVEIAVALRSETKPLRRQLMCHVLHEILGAEPALQVIQKEMARPLPSRVNAAQREQQQANLQAAIAELREPTKLPIR